MEQTLRALLVRETHCDIQHTGWPCNTCFHALNLLLKYDIHEYWLAVLAERGDYPDEPKRPELIHELLNALKTVGGSQVFAIPI